MARSSNLGDTWRNRYGTRVGVQVRTTHGTVEPIRIRTAVWSSDGSPVLGDPGWTHRSGKMTTAEPVNSSEWAALAARTAFRMAEKETPAKSVFYRQCASETPCFFASKPPLEILNSARVHLGMDAPCASRWLAERTRRFREKFGSGGELGESYWTLTGRVRTGVPEKSGAWAALIAKTAFQKAAAEAPSQKVYFDNRIAKSDAFYAAMYKQSKSVPEILAHAKGVIGSSAPNAKAWLTSRALAFAIKFEGYEPPTSKASRAPRTYEEDSAPVEYTPPSGSWMEKVDTWAKSTESALAPGGTLRNVLIAGGVVAISYPVLSMAIGAARQK